MIAKAWLAAGRYRLGHGRFPEQLPEDLVDPFDGKPLRHSLDDGALKIWSVGQDLDDDGGAPWDWKTRDGDIVWPIPTNTSPEDTQKEAPHEHPTPGR